MNGAIKRFRIMALVAGVMSLLLWFVDLPVAYLFNNEDWKAKVEWIPFVHGWIYAICDKSALVFHKDALANTCRHLANCILRRGAQSCSPVFVN